jgi:hypothetical protein
VDGRERVRDDFFLPVARQTASRILEPGAKADRLRTNPTVNDRGTNKRRITWPNASN